MSFESTTRLAGPIVGDGSTVLFAFTFKVFTAADLLVVLTDADGIETVQTITTHYTVSLNADQNNNPGGTITMVTAPAAAAGSDPAEKLTISSDVEETQPLVIRNQSSFYPRNIEDALDRGMIVSQQILGTLGRSIQIPISDGVSLTTELPTAANRALKAIVFDANGNVAVSADDYNDQASNAAASASAAASSATAAAASETLAEEWATKTDGLVDATDNSSKAYAIGGTGVTDTAGKGAAKEWATKAEDSTVDGTEYSALHYAAKSSASATSAASSAAAAAATAAGIKWRNSVRTATTANITLSGEQTIDGVLTSGDRVLVKDQTATEDNGIYVTASGAWTRATDMDAWSEVPSTAVFVEEGSTQADTSWVCTADQGGALGTTAITFSQFGQGDMRAENNLSELTNAATARTNLGLGSVALLNSIATGNIDNDAVTLAKIATLTADRLVGSDGSGNPSEITLAAALSLSTSSLALNFASQAEAEAGTATDKPMNALRVAQAIAAQAGGGGLYVQAVENVQNATQQTITTSTWVDTGVQVTITPTSSSNDIELDFMFNAFLQTSGTTELRPDVRILRGASTVIWDSGGYYGTAVPSGSEIFPLPVAVGVTDSPATTSATTYKVQMRVAFGSGNLRVPAGASASTARAKEVTV